MRAIQIKLFYHPFMTVLIFVSSAWTGNSVFNSGLSLRPIATHHASLIPCISAWPRCASAVTLWKVRRVPFPGLIARIFGMVFTSTFFLSTPLCLCKKQILQTGGEGREQTTSKRQNFFSRPDKSTQQGKKGHKGQFFSVRKGSKSNTKKYLRIVSNFLVRLISKFFSENGDQHFPDFPFQISPAVHSWRKRNLMDSSSSSQQSETSSPASTPLTESSKANLLIWFPYTPSEAETGSTFEGPWDL